MVLDKLSDVESLSCKNVSSIHSKSQNDNTSDVGIHQLITKQDWLGREAKSFTNITFPINTVIIKHTGGGTCDTLSNCAGKVQTIQAINIAGGKPDIYCNFLIGGDGNIYVGRGWNVQNAQRSGTIDIVFIGNFDIIYPSNSMVEAARLLMEDGIKTKKLDQNYKVVCHNQTAMVRSPGVNLFNEVKTWPHYHNGSFF